MLLDILFAAFLALPQTVSITPNVFHIPEDKESAGGSPNWDMSKVGYSTFHIQYSNGPTVFPANGSIEVFFGYELRDYGATNNPTYTGNFDYISVPNAGTSQSPIDAFQISSPTAPNFTTVSAPVGCKLKLVSRVHNSEKILQIKFLQSLPAFSIVDITFGDTSQGSPGAIISWNPGRPRVVVLEDTAGNGTYSLSPAIFPITLFTGETVTSFAFTLPIITTVNVPFDFTIKACQGRDWTPDSPILPVEDFQGTIEIIDLSNEFALLSTPQELSFQRSDQGVKHLKGVFNHTGNHILRVSTENSQSLISTLSNSNITSVQASPAYGIYVGDLQRHAGEGGHACIPDWMCWRSLYDNGDDYGCVVEHSQLAFAGWHHQNNVAHASQLDFDPQEKTFIAFPGYEYGLDGGHRHVVFKTFTTDPSLVDNQYFGGETPGPILAPTLNDFLYNLHNPPTPSIPRIAIIHHSLWDKSTFPNIPFDWGPFFDDSVQTLVEIYSTHGSSERFVTAPTSSDYVMGHDPLSQRPVTEAASVQDALKMGYYFGIIGGSDRHGYTNNFSSGDDSSGPYNRTGKSFVYGDMSIPGLRDRIWDGISKRHVYGTTGARINLSFTTNTGAMMGDKISGQNIIFNVTAIASNNEMYKRSSIFQFIIYRDGDNQVYQEGYGYNTYSIVESWSDPSPPTDGLYHPYYVKIIQDDNHIAWSSPIWVRY